MCFKIAIVVDNRKAADIYRKAIADLQSIWPEIMKFCEQIDGYKERQYQAKLATHKVMLEAWDAKYERDKAAYDIEFAEYNKARSSFFGVGNRLPPVLPTRHYDFLGFAPDKPLHNTISHYEEIRDGLVRKAYLAEMAIEPFAMDESTVNQMQRWGNGLKIAELRQNMEATRARLLGGTKP